MARKKSTIPASIRLRDNQRRSRATHKAYVASLQARIATYEARGVEASLELRRAARSVARENGSLRELLMLKGVGAEEVEAWLIRSREGEEACEEERRGGWAMVDRESVGVSAEKGHAAIASAVSNTNMVHHHRQQISRPTGPPQPPPLSVVYTNAPSTVSCTSSSSSSSSASSSSASSSCSPRGLDTSCQEAAAIITAMRWEPRYLHGHGYDEEEERVRGELGCEAGALLASCRVGNVRLMDVLDVDVDGERGRGRGTS